MKLQTESRHWVFVVSGNMVGENGAIPPRRLLTERLDRKHWPLRKATSGRKELREGDDVVFYLGPPEFVFGGCAKLAGECIESPAALRDFGSESEDYPQEFTVGLRAVVVWEKPVSVRAMAAALNLFPNKESWGGYLQSAVVRLTGEDFAKIVAAGKKGQKRTRALRRKGPLPRKG